MLTNLQYAHHDALEFPVRVLHLPTAEQIAAEPPKAVELPQAHSVEDEIGYIGFEPVW